LDGNELIQVNMMKWRILYSGKAEPAENMAVDEAIMNGVIKGTSPFTIRFYDWSPPTISCGFNQIASNEVDLNVVANSDYGFVRRPTGGRLVLHEDEVTYAVIAAIEGKLAGNITESYLASSKALAHGFKFLGVDVDLEKGSLSSIHQRQDLNPCFASSSRFELNYQNKKIVGSAQVRKEGVLLQHGSILLDHNQAKLAEFMPNLDAEKKVRLANYLAKKTISINQILSLPITFSEAVTGFTIGFEAFWHNDEFVITDSLLPS